MTRRIGGTFAPALPAEKLATYKSLADGSGPKVREAMRKLISMIEEFRKTPDSANPGMPHPSGLGIVVPLEDAEIARMDEHVPWQEELNLWGAWFDAISPTDAKELRDAAFHLLWFGRELFLDREPMTSDKIKR